MVRIGPRTLAASCFALMAFAPAASAERAPIVFAGQGNAPAPTETASLEANALAGGGEDSYGYGSSQRARSGAVIDIRRGARTTTNTPSYSEPQPQAPSPAPAYQSAPQSAAAEEGAPQWLERERVGPPYEANGRWYVPTPEPGYEQTGVASWYGPQFHGQRTASGETFDQDALTAAHPTLPIPSLVQVTNLENGREVIVRVNDRGPFVGERLIDLSRGSAEVLGFENAGQARVHVRYLGPAPRRVNADGAPAPASAPSPMQSAHVENGPVSLLPPSTEPPQQTALAGGLDRGFEETQLPAPRVPAPQPAYAPAPTSGGYVVQIGAYSDPANAERVRNAVATAGPVSVDVRRSASGMELFRVRVGPWASWGEAEEARRTLAALGYGESVVASR